MPTYEYVCHGCGKAFEYFQSMKEDPKTECEECGGRLERLISAGGGLIFKGSGFYITDYAKGSSTATSATASDQDLKPTVTKDAPASSDTSSSTSSSTGDKPSAPTPKSE